jgi:hypothetical protein
VQNLRAAAAVANKSSQSASPLKWRHGGKLSPAQAVLLGANFEQVGRAGSDHRPCSCIRRAGGQVPSWVM